MAGLAGAVRAVVAGGRRPAARSTSSASSRAVPVSAAAGGPGATAVPDAAPAGQRAADLAALAIVERQRGSAVGSVRVTEDTALRHSGVWASLRLRANLESSLPVDTFRKIGGIAVEVPKPQILIEPYPGVDIGEHFYSSRVDLDRYGNSVAIIRAVNALGLPSALELVPMCDVTARMKGWEIDHWRICGARYERHEVWHERQNTVGGLPLGLGAIAYGAWSIGGYLSAQQFVTDWFMGGAAPAGVLRNVIDDELDDTTIEKAKARFRLATAGRDIFVTGADWEWIPAAMDAQSAGFMEERGYGLGDAARFLDVPGDMIDAPTSGSSITYANITQRNLQLLVTSMGPAIDRRERFWTRRALPQPRYVKLNTRAFLRLDPQTQTQLLLSQVAGKTLTPSEARALDDRAPFTPEQLDELRTFGIITGSPAAPAGEVVPA